MDGWWAGVQEKDNTQDGDTVPTVSQAIALAQPVTQVLSVTVHPGPLNSGLIDNLQYDDPPFMPTERKDAQRVVPITQQSQ